MIQATDGANVGSDYTFQEQFVLRTLPIPTAWLLLELLVLGSVIGLLRRNEALKGRLLIVCLLGTVLPLSACDGQKLQAVTLQERLIKLHQRTAIQQGL